MFYVLSMNNIYIGGMMIEEKLELPRKTSHSNIEATSKVLLVCVYDTIAFEITNQLIYSNFCQFGTINRVLIFEKKDVTKLFLEFSTHAEAASAKENMDGRKLYNNICKMSIYFSAFNNVDLRHQSSEGYDFYEQSNNSAFSSNISDYQNSSFGKRDLDQINPFSAQSRNQLIQRTRSDQHDLAWHIKKVQDDIWGFPLDICSQIESDIDSIIQDDFENETEQYNVQKINPQLAMPVPKIKAPEASTESSVMGFSYKNSIKVSQIYNLFSNFGNISMIMITKKQVKVKYRSSEFAVISFNYLKSFTLEGNRVELAYYPNNSCLPLEGEFAEIMCYDSTFDRFTPKKSITINPPSRVLHVSGMKKEKCSQIEIEKIFSCVCVPMKVKILKKSVEKNMALVEFKSLEESFRAISECHNMNVTGRKIQISFTKSQI